MKNDRVEKTISSTVQIKAKREKIWNNITNVNIEQFSHSFIFKLLNIPKPLKAEILSEGRDGIRIAYFDNRKKFIQKILVWKPMTQYSFAFNPENGFKVGFFFDLSKGIFQISQGSYFLSKDKKGILLKLCTIYSINRCFFPILYFPIFTILKLFQRFLLSSIKKNSEQ